MDNGSPSRCSWADEAKEELPSLRSLGAGSPSQLSDVAALLGSPERISFTDSESYSDSEPPSLPPAGKGKAVEGASGRRRRHRRWRRWPRADGFLVATRRSHPQPGPLDASPPASPCRRASPSTHPARALAEPDADGFYEVRSRRRWRHRSPLRVAWPVPIMLQGLCFNCLTGNHIKRDCVFPARCFNCLQKGHRSSACPLPPRQGKRGHSSPQAGHGERVAVSRAAPQPPGGSPPPGEGGAPLLVDGGKGDSWWPA